MHIARNPTGATGKILPTPFRTPHRRAGKRPYVSIACDMAFDGDVDPFSVPPPYASISRWKDATEEEKLAAITLGGLTSGADVFAATVRLAPDLQDLARRHPDRFRARVCRYVNKVSPVWAFVIEADEAHALHLHGIVIASRSDVPAIRAALADLSGTTSSFRWRAVRTKTAWSSTWPSYCVKSLDHTRDVLGRPDRLLIAPHAAARLGKATLDRLRSIRDTSGSSPPVSPIAL